MPDKPPRETDETSIDIGINQAPNDYSRAADQWIDWIFKKNGAAERVLAPYPDAKKELRFEISRIIARYEMSGQGDTPEVKAEIAAEVAAELAKLIRKYRKKEFAE